MKDKAILQETIRMAWPAILESFFVALAGLVDSYMVSTLGAASVAAVGLTTQPKFMGLALFFAVNVSVSALVARRLGERRRDDANQIVISAVLFITIMSIIVSSVCVISAKGLMLLCGATAETLPDAVTYFRIIMGGMFFNCLLMVVNSAQRGSGNTRITMTTNLVSNGSNVILNYLLIGGHLGFPALGIRGAALATVLGTVIGCIMSVRSICSKNTFVSIPYLFERKIKPSIYAIRDMIKVGYGIFFEQILMRMGFMLTAIMAADKGTNAMAAHQVAMNIMGLSFSFGDGLQAAAVALIGRSLGEKKPDLAKIYGATCRRMGLIISLILAFLYFISRRWLYSMFFAEEEIIQIGVNITYIIMFVVIFQVSQVIYMGCLRGAGDTLYTAIASTICVTVIRSIVSYVCGYPLHLGIEGIWMGVLADQVGRYVFASLRFRQGRWVNIKI